MARTEALHRRSHSRLREHWPVDRHRRAGQARLLLCKRRGRLQLVVRTRTHFELNWYPVEASAEMATKLAEVVKDIRTHVQTEALDDIPERPIPNEATGICERPYHG